MWKGLILTFFLAIVSSASAQTAVFLVRHADRLDWSHDAALSKAGKDRSERLALLLKDAGITAIYQTQFKRTQKTAEPLARMLNIKPISFPSDDYRSLYEHVRTNTLNETVLIVGHDSTVPPLLRLFGHSEPVTIAANEYDNLFVLVPTQKGPPTVIRLRY